MKGAVSRSEPKKSWSLKFNTDGYKGRDWKGWKGIGLKTASGAKTVTNQLTVELYRAMMVQTYRTSFAEFWINDIFIGLVRFLFFLIQPSYVTQSPFYNSTLSKRNLTTTSWNPVTMPKILVSF